MPVGTVLKTAAFGAALLWSAPPAAADGRWQKCRLDNATDPHSKKPRKRAEEAMTIRKHASRREYDGSKTVCHFANSDTELAAKFSKTLPHNELGEVDPDAYSALQDCVSSGDFEVCEAVPAGFEGGKLVNPLGGIAVDMACPAGSGLTIPPAPELDSPELAASLAECYWMAVARDVPFVEYGENETTVTAAANLMSMPGYPVESNYLAMSANGTSIDPLKQLFRASFVGVNKGPMMSQLLANNFVIDSIPVDVKQSPYAPGMDYMTDWESFLHIQNGGPANGTEAVDETLRYIRNGRDLAKLAATDVIYTEAFRGALVLLATGGIMKTGANGPYANSTRQGGFVNWGASHLMRVLGTGECAQRGSWYQKWQVHMLARPEAFAGLVHNTMNGDLEYPIDSSLLTNSELLDRVVASNAKQNADTEGDSYLLSQVTKSGSPAHPSYPAGHAVQNGAFATILKAMCGPNLGQSCFPDPIESSADGLKMVPYVPAADEKCIGLDGVETTGLTFEGEINKMATNIGFGRSFMGVHYRFDSTEGIFLGETVAVRMIHVEIMSLPEEWPCEFNLFRGNTIKLYPDGTFSIDGKMCSGHVYSGIDDC